MKLRILLIFVVFIAFVSVSKSAHAGNEIENVFSTKVDKYIRYVYDRIKFPKNNKLKFEAFKYGFYGYLNMMEAGKISRGATLSICDFNLSSNEKRLWVIDIKNKKVLFNTLVAHGMGTGEEYAVNFSNIEESHQSSLGFYTTAETYIGNNGYSLKLNGVDGNFNNKAYDRAVVIHGAEYVSDDFAKANQRLGRSHGCPALPVELAPKIIDRIKGDQCLFVYHASKNYLKNSYWLTNKIQHLPDDAELMDLNIPNNPRYNANVKEEQDYANASKSNSALIDKQGFPIESSSKKVTSTKENKDLKERKVTSIILVQENPDGTSDTTIVK